MGSDLHLGNPLPRHLLERHATPDQKRRKIDLVDFLFEST
jgi:hypothetical protein